MALSTLSVPLAGGKKAARGNGQPEHSGLDQRRARKTPCSRPDLHRGPNERRKRQRRHLAPAPYVETQDPAWYAEQAARLRDELERRQAQLDGYRQAIEDARSP